MFSALTDQGASSTGKSLLVAFTFWLNQLLHIRTRTSKRTLSERLCSENCKVDMVSNSA